MVNISFDIATLVSAILVLIVGWMNFRQSRKSAFINTITVARKEYIAELRKAVADFCVAAMSKDVDERKLLEASYRIKTFMNPIKFDKDWDSEAIKLINKIINPEPGNGNTDKRKEDIDKFLTLMQSWLALEWEGILAEGEHGILSEFDKQELRDKYYIGYTKHISASEPADKSAS